jgi:MFS family permease
MDWRGALLAAAGLGTLVYGLIAAAPRGWGDATVLISLGLGAILLVAFVFNERVSRSPMMPLELFRSRVFSGINLMTLLLYGALGGAFFFLPFLLIQARGYSATAAGAAYLPFTFVLGLLSRWSGGLLDRFGARGPLLVGSAITASGFLWLSFASGPYWTILLPMTWLGFGMAITVAPLTAAVINAVPAHRTGVASGINNAVASVGSLLVIAVLGSVALNVFQHSLERGLREAQASDAVAAAVRAARGGFVMPPLPAGLSGTERGLAHSIVADSLAGTVSLALWIATALAFASVLVAAVTLPPRASRAPGTSAADSQRVAAD